MAKDLINLSLEHVAPSSIKHDKNVSAAIKAIDPELMSVSQSISEAFIIARIDELPELLIDLLAWQWHVDYYEPDLSLEVKRRLVKTSISWHRIKGTPQAVEQLVTQLFGNAKVSEWFDYNGRAYFFRVAVNIGGLNTLDMDAAALAKLRRVIKCAQNARSWLEFISLIYDLEDTQLTREDLATLKIATGYADYYPYKLLGDKRRWIDYDSFNGALSFAGDNTASFDAALTGLGGSLSFGGSDNFTGEIKSALTRVFDGSLNFGDLSALSSFGGGADLINIGEIWLKLRLNAFSDDYSQELISAEFNGALSFNGLISLLAAPSFDGSLSFNGLNTGMYALTLPYDAAFEFSMKTVVADTERISELDKITLKYLHEDFYFAELNKLNSFDGLINFGGELVHDAKIDLSGAFNFDNPVVSWGELAANEAYNRDKINLITHGSFNDDYSREVVSAEFKSAAALDGSLSFNGPIINSNALSFNGELELQACNRLLDASLDFSGTADFTGESEHKIYLQTPREVTQQIDIKLDYQDTERDNLGEREFYSCVKLCSDLTGGLDLGGSITFGFETFSGDNFEITRCGSLAGGLSLDGGAEFAHGTRPLITAA